MRNLLAASFALVMALAAVHWHLIMTASMSYATTFDETAHIVAGYSYVLFKDYRLNPENGALPQLAAGFMVARGGHKFPPTSHPAWHYSDEWNMGYKLLYDVGNNLEDLLWDGRSAIATCSSAIIILVFFLGVYLFREISLAVFIGPIIAAFSPTLIANGGLITSDTFMGFFFTLSPVLLWWIMNIPTGGDLKSFLNNNSWPVLLAGLATGGLCVAKHSGVIIAFVVLVMIPFRVSRLLRAPGSLPSKLLTVAELGFRLTAAVFLTIFVVWWAYGFRFGAFNHETCEEWRTAGMKSVMPPLGPLHTTLALLHKHQLLPESFLYGFAYAVKSAVARNAFLFGRHGVHGWWWFFPFAVIVKTPAATLLLAFIGLPLNVSLSSVGKSPMDFSQSIWYRFVPIFALWAVYWVVAIFTNLNIGHRHMLPTYPAMFLFGGVAVHVAHRHMSGLRRVICLSISLLLAVLAVAEPYPHLDTPLAFFNAPAGGPPNGYKLLVDSSLDWGQDLPRFRDWVNATVSLPDYSNKNIYLSYFGMGNPNHYKLDKHVRYLHGSMSGPTRPLHMKSTEWDLLPGYYAFGASMFQSVYNGQASGTWNAYYESLYRRGARMVRRLMEEGDAGRAVLTADGHTLPDMYKLVEWFDAYRVGRMCAQLRHRKPDVQIGYSILIFKLTQKDLDLIFYGPPPTEISNYHSPYLRGIKYEHIPTQAEE